MTKNMARSIDRASTCSNRCILDMVVSIMSDSEYWEIIGSKITKALERNCSLTSVWSLSLCKVQDCSPLGRVPDSSKSGFYVTFEGTRCSVSFYINNDMKVIRKPRSLKVNHEYTFYLDEGFWFDLEDNRNN